MAQGGYPENADQQIRAGRGLPDRFFLFWPGKWERLGADLCRFFSGWSRRDVENLTGTEMIAEIEKANVIAAEDKREAERAQRRR
ncbi:hypothetical protein AA0616_3289 [Komagataeibacter nataicola NRIC 0616]|nr:hypothetical protein AA0616_3289 [Komagataeibacter nataicola NRIC 0616]